MITAFADATWYRLWWAAIAVLTILAARLVLVNPIVRATNEQTVAMVEAQAQMAAVIVEADAEAAALIVAAHERTTAAIDRQTDLLTGREPATAVIPMRASPVAE